MFKHMDDDSKRFYARIFNTSMLNAWAVRHGLFDTLLCETDDPRIIGRWRTEVPRIIETLAKMRRSGSWE